MTILIILAGILVLLSAIWLLKVFSSKINFYATGLDHKFNFNEISILWKLAKVVELEEPEALFVSTNSLNRCITNLIETSRREGTEGSDATQEFLSKLYKFRTKIELASENKRGLETSRALSNGQKLRLILKGNGIFASKILNNSRDLVITIPIQDGRIKIPPEDWKDKEVSVYLWRKGDAGYVFDTKVLAYGVFWGQNVLYLAHSDKLFRAQKRKSIRTECHIPAHLYIVKEAITDYSQVETTPGFKCIVEDISSDGAMVRIGGKGVNNIQIKLQFELENMLILMHGLVRSVEYNQPNNQSRLHVECLHIEPSMRNIILSFVYKVLPEDQKNAEEALTQLEDEEREEAKNESPAQEPVAAEPLPDEPPEESISIDIPTVIDPEFIEKESPSKDLKLDPLEKKEDE